MAALLATRALYTNRALHGYLTAAGECLSRPVDLENEYGFYMYNYEIRYPMFFLVLRRPFVWQMLRNDTSIPVLELGISLCFKASSRICCAKVTPIMGTQIFRDEEFCPGRFCLCRGSTLGCLAYQAANGILPG